MCGRTACTLAPDELCTACQSRGLNVIWRDHPGNSGHNYYTSYNVAPTSYTPIMFSGEHLKTLSDEEAASDYIMQPMMWSLIPSFFKGDNPKSHGYTTNNCRVEGVQNSKMFAPLLKRRQRCVVLCDGFYEWQTTTKSKSKTPYFIYSPQPEHVKIWDRSSWEDEVKVNGKWNGPTPLKMAGLFSKWTSQEEEVWSYTVVTMEAGKGFNWLHHRVPVILETDQQVQDWLDPSMSEEKVFATMSGSPDLRWHQVSSEVNNSRNNVPDCMKPTDTKEAPKSPSSQLMSAWLSRAKPVPTSSNEPKRKLSGSDDLSSVKKEKFND